MIRARQLAFMVLALMVAALGLRAQAAGAENPWALYVEEQGGAVASPPICQSLNYFSSSPLQFDDDHQLSLTPDQLQHYTTQRALIGVVSGRHIYQVMQGWNSGHPIDPNYWQVRRVLVERASREYCMIFQTTSPGDDDFGLLDSVDLAKVRGHMLLYSEDAVIGNGGVYQGEAWVFDQGLPYHLDFDSIIQPELERILPPGDSVNIGNPLNVEALEFSGPVAKPMDSLANPSGGAVRIELGIHGHELYVVSAQYSPNG